jgi:hypothetical protein
VDPAEGLSRLVTAFALQLPDVADAAMVSADGLPLASSAGLHADRVDQLAAATSGIISLVRGAARVFQGGSVERVAIIMEQGMLILIPAGKNSVLAVLTASDGDADLVVREMGLLRERAGAVLAAQEAMLGRD